MFIRPSSVVLPIVALAAVATAAPSTLEARDQCNTGSISCCNSTFASTATTLASLGGLLGLSLPSIGGLIGLSCSPITGLGTGTGAVCLQQPVCCTDNSYNGVVNLGCSPINLNL